MSAVSLHAKSIVIIGGSTGLGLSAAHAFVDNGASVVIVGRDADHATKAAQELGGETKARAVIGDAAAPDTAEIRR